ncbi:hypothetical protein JCM19237_308 [Photobacterium aphoticum]|uniref:Uncharacterized protein n=1 Tax=Photobacterium aphoticum TaxID=754436 RepID=A0A090R081_9GAMM|nr:hypothetical protein JCM19237_308 [Photobacterium aphoticum]
MPGLSKVSALIFTFGANVRMMLAGDWSTKNWVRLDTCFNCRQFFSNALISISSPM